jgi:hypothetical protein
LSLLIQPLKEGIRFASQYPADVRMDPHERFPVLADYPPNIRRSLYVV